MTYQFHYTHDAMRASDGVAQAPVVPSVGVAMPTANEVITPPAAAVQPTQTRITTDGRLIDAPVKAENEPQWKFACRVYGYDVADIERDLVRFRALRDGFASRAA